jgi:hypothetical protein
VEKGIVILVVLVALCCVGGSLIASFPIWIGALIIVVVVFAAGNIKKIWALNDCATLSGLVEPHFNGFRLSWAINESACKSYPSEGPLAFLSGLFGFAWIFAVWTWPFLSETIKNFILENRLGIRSEIDTLFTIGTVTSFVLVVCIFYLGKWHSASLRSALIERIASAENSLAKTSRVNCLEQEIAKTSARLGFDFPLTFSSELESYIQTNKTNLLAELSPLEQKISELTSDAESVSAALRKAAWELDEARDAYKNSLRVVTKSGSIALIQGLEQIHAYLNTTALTEFLTARRWEDFREAVTDAIKEIEHLCAVSRDYQKPNANRETISAAGMSRQVAMKILKLKEGYTPEEVRKAWRDECKKWNIDQRQNYEPHILEKIQDHFKDVNEAKEVLLSQI